MGEDAVVAEGGQGAARAKAGVVCLVARGELRLQPRVRLGVFVSLANLRLWLSLWFRAFFAPQRCALALALQLRLVEVRAQDWCVDRVAGLLRGPSLGKLDAHLLWVSLHQLRVASSGIGRRCLTLPGLLLRLAS